VDKDVGFLVESAVGFLVKKKRRRVPGGDIPQRQPNQLRRFLMVRKLAAGFDDLSQLRVDTPKEFVV
jgi:hypothetical protein